MSCTPTCVKPSPTNAHCGACHQTFGGVTGFDRHRRGGECLTARDIGMHADRNGVWRYAGPDPTARPIWPQRDADQARLASGETT